MRVAVLRPVLVLSLGSAAVLAAQQPAPVSGSTKQLQPTDLKAWKSIRSSVLSSDGKWFAYVLAPNEGDANVIIRSTGTDNKEFTFPIGAPTLRVAAAAADEAVRHRMPAADRCRSAETRAGWRSLCIRQRRAVAGDAAVRVVAVAVAAAGALRRPMARRRRPAAEQARGGQSRHRREKRIRPRAALRVQR